jgi:hypothetical protein
MAMLVNAAPAFKAMGALYSLVLRSWLTSGRLLVTGYGQGAPCDGVSLSASLSATVPSGRGSGFLHLLPAQALRCGFQKLRRDSRVAFDHRGGAPNQQGDFTVSGHGIAKRKRWRAALSRRKLRRRYRARAYHATCRLPVLAVTRSVVTEHD